ncbi:shikimate kinase [Hymenobacter edaphi]|uniref:Shikimate kinase n=1 Tax=Hymenobacter edaphi TaxID=2211146 RepID=A0A328BLT9_9BACT|nr:shikimate kinase [Hymenobacter edaphi]RAK68073.1 shikimate kinase [Hymenobacter edaphi]
MSADQFTIHNPAFRIHLVGMPAAGKTTLGRGLAVRFELPFRDLDEEIVRREQRSVADIFAAEGEAYFRQVEADTLRAVLAEHPRLVLATGGGTPCFHHNMALLNQTGLALWLDVPVAELAARLQHAATTRPLLAALPDAAALARRLAETLAARQGFYGQAALRCAGPTCTVEAAYALVQRYLATS